MRGLYQRSESRAGSLMQARDAAQIHREPTFLRDRNAHGLRLAFVLTESGDEEWYAVCAPCEWASVGGSRVEAQAAACEVCRAHAEAQDRRLGFRRRFGVAALVALFNRA